MHAFTDGRTVRLLPSAQDHKQVYDGDMGPNTGGMGAISPCALLTPAQVDYVRTEVMQRTVDGMREEGRVYCGVLYAGLMLTADGIMVLEFNCRFGDPETEVMMPLLACDIYPLLRACAAGYVAQPDAPTLDSLDVPVHSGKFVCDVVLVSAGYPMSYEKNKPIGECCSRFVMAAP